MVEVLKSAVYISAKPGQGLVVVPLALVMSMNLDGAVDITLEVLDHCQGHRVSTMPPGRAAPAV